MDRFFVTSDGVKLYYRVSGKGFPLVILPGLGQDTTKFEKNYDALGAHFTVYCLDHRGHGLSQAPEYGFHVERLAKDFEELLTHCGLDRIFLLGHSMGNSVSWSYFSMFGQDKVVKYILEEQAPCLVCDPAWTALEKETYTGTIHRRTVFDSDTDLKGLTHDAGMRTRLLHDHLGRDWRDIIETIKIPTLVLMGEISQFNATPLVGRWLHEHIKGSRLEVITKEENGTHDLHLTSPDRFNQIVLDFLHSEDSRSGSQAVMGARS